MENSKHPMDVRGKNSLTKLSLPTKLVFASLVLLNLDASASVYTKSTHLKLTDVTTITLPFKQQAADIKIAGQIVDENGQPLPGVSVKVKGGTLGTSTNTEGKFSLNVPGDAILVISYIGYERQEVGVDGKTNLTISLKPTSNNLNAVVVTALGIKKETKTIGYSTTQLSGSDFTESRDVNLGNALTGKVAGVSVANNSTGASGSSRVVIRGNASLTGNNQPLYVIDGIPFDNTNQGSAGQYGGVDLGDGLSNINPDDIENIQVLKGVAASALYGYRGGNGAILVTTKSGSKSKGLGIELNNNLTFNSIIDYRDLQTTYGQGTQGLKPTTATGALNTANLSWGAVMDGSDATNILGNTYKYAEASSKDNWKNFYQTGVNNATSVAISGSTEKINYRFGVSNLYNTSNVPNSGMKQQGFNLNSTYHITSKLTLSVTANYIFEQVKNRTLLSDASTNINATMMYLANSYDVRWLQGRTKADGTELTPGTGQYFNNPYFLAYDHQNQTDRNRLTAGATLKYDITPWLYLQAQVTRDGYILDYTKITPTGTAYANGGELTQFEKNYRELNGNFLLGFHKKLNAFSIDATAGGNSQDNLTTQYGLDGTASPFIIPYLYTANNIASRSYTQTYAKYRVNSFYGTADFGYKDFLYLNVTGRNDWFSTLSTASNHYFYPSVSGSFVFSSLLKMPTWISSGKLRASYAEGSNGTSPYQNYLTYGLRTYTIDGNSVGYVTNSTVPNSNLKPVQIKEKEIGLNMQFLDNRVGFDVDYYNKETSNDIATVTNSTASGYNAAIVNVGRIQNKGIEGLINGTPIKTKNFSWNSSFNIGYNMNKVLYLGDGVTSLAIDGAVPRNGDGVTISNVVGKSFGQIMGYAYLRDKSGNIIYGSDGLPERSSTVQALGSGAYKVTGGFSNEFHYKRFQMSFLIDYKYGAKVFSGTNLSLYAAGLQKTTLQGRVGGYVGPGVTESGAVNTTAVDAQTYWTDLTSSDFVAEQFVYDASFIKLRQLTFGYSLPTSFLEKISVKGATISLVTRNLWTIMKHTPNIDPESAYNNGNGQGLEGNGYLPTRSLGFNLNVKF